MFLRFVHLCDPSMHAYLIIRISPSSSICRWNMQGLVSLPTSLNRRTAFKRDGVLLVRVFCYHQSSTILIVEVDVQGQCIVECDTVRLYYALFGKLVCHLQSYPNPITDLVSTDKAAHLILPNHPILRPHARMLHHFRFIVPLLPRDQDGLSPLHYYDSVIQLVRHASGEPTEAEFALGITAAEHIKKM